MYEGDLEKALVEFTSFETRHPGRKREISMANLFQGYLHGKLGNWDECRKYYEKVIAEDLTDPREMFSFRGEHPGI